MNRKGLKFTLDIPESFPDYIKGDGQRIRQVITNLVGNAVKFTSSGFVSLSCVYEQENMRIEVIDSGVGINESEQDTVFDPFVQSGSETAPPSGTGLGLAISRKLARLMNGDIIVDSIINKGSKFTFILPVEESDGECLTYKTLQGKV